jgi:hypothetical protein
MSSVIKITLISLSTSGLVSSIMWKLTEPDDRWLWFSRLALGLICLGMAGIIDAIEKKSDGSK